MIELPQRWIWLDAEAIGKMLSYDARVITEKFAPRPDFPRPARIGNKGRPRWRADEVAAWMEQWRASPDDPQRPACEARSTSPAAP